MNILLTNDDGYFSRGIKSIYSEFSIENSVTVIAPATEQSGVGHGFTYKQPLYFEDVDFMNTKAHAVLGTPADCVKYGLGHLNDLEIDVVVSGINAGNNAGIAGFYSGTVAAAREAAFWKVPAIAFSLCEGGEEFFDEYAKISKQIFEKIFMDIENIDSRVFYNVNFPNCSPSESRGVKITRQSMAFYKDSYTVKKDEKNREQLWLHGIVTDLEDSNHYDMPAVYDDYITITPLNFDQTDSEEIKNLKDLQI